MLDQYYSPFLFPYHSTIDDLKLVRANVVLGVLGKHCRGLGVCKIVNWKAKPEKCTSVNVFIDSPQPDLLRFHFQKAKLCAKATARYFGGSYFVVEEPFELPEFVRTELSVSKTIVESGAYPIIESYKFFIVNFYFNY